MAAVIMERVTFMMLPPESSVTAEIKNGVLTLTVTGALYESTFLLPRQCNSIMLCEQYARAAVAALLERLRWRPVDA